MTERRSSHGAERIGPTAHYTAYVWRRLGLPNAEHFATGQGAALYWGFFVLGEWMTRLSPAIPSMREYLEARHRLIDRVVDRLQPGLLVELGAGLTPRAVTWAADRGVPGIELDLPAMVALKRQRLARAPAALRQRLRGRHRLVEADVLAPAFAQQLSDWMQGSSRPVVVAEGLLSYFDEAARRQVLHSVARALRTVGGGVMVCDLHTVAAQAKVGWALQGLRLAQRGLTRRRRALEPFADLGTVHEAFETAGFDHTHQEHRRDHADADPRLARLRSPAHIFVARVGPPDAS